MTTNEIPAHIIERREKLHVAIGSLIVSFQELEMGLRSIAGVLMNPKDRRIGDFVTCEMSFNGVLNAVGSLSKYRFQNKKSVRDLLEGFIRRATKAEEERNKIVHSFWLEDKDGKHIRIKITAKWKKGGVPIYEPHPPDKILKVQEEVDALAKGVWGSHSLVKLCVTHPELVP